jgi:hypothetical protein
LFSGLPLIFDVKAGIPPQQMESIMNINAVGGNVGPAGLASASPVVRGERETERSGRAQAVPHGPGGPVVEAVTQTLSQLGIGNLSETAPPPVSKTDDVRTSNDEQTSASSTGQSVGQALQGFTFALFQALGPGDKGSSGKDAPPPPPPPPERVDSIAGSDRRGPPPAGANPPPGAGSSGYGDLVTRLQNLSQSLTSGGTDATPSGLNSAFQNLKSTLQGSSGENTTDLPTFVKTLAQNLVGAGSAAQAKAGNVINTSA